MISQWDFLEKVARAAFANPFGPVRDELDLQLSGSDAEASAEEILRGVLHRVEEALAAFAEKDIQRHEGKKGEVVRSVVLFALFHRFADNFDSLILSQSRSDSPLPLPFAADLLRQAGSWGFSDQEAERYLAVFYQLRRAFYFIRHGLVGTSTSMKTLRKQIWDCVFTHDIRWFESRFWNRMEEFSVLLLGETGTGKGAAAAAIGRSGFIPYEPARNRFSESFTRNFLAINLSQFSEGVLESELFGHRKGAFTGAVDNHEGVFGRCVPHGAIFLDEMGDVSVPVQIKLLQVLQDRHFFPVGSHQAKRFSGRVIAATNRDLDALREKGKFREDLYYRLCSQVITLPPLRRRLEEEPAELGMLVESILRRIAGESSARERKLVLGALRRGAGKTYRWPGNVRELEQGVKRLILTGGYRPAQRREPGGEQSLFAAIAQGEIGAAALLQGYCRLLYERFGTYEEVARRTGLDRRTVKKHVADSGEPKQEVP